MRYAKTICLRAWKVKQTHEGYIAERQRGEKVRNLNTRRRKKEESGSRGCIAMSLKKVIESPEDQKERLTRRGQGLESIRTNCRERGGVRDRETQAGRRSEE